MAENNITKVDETLIGDTPIAYKCDYHIKSGAISNETAKIVPSYYDLLYPCDSSSSEAITFVASNMLTDIATKFKILPSGSACSLPDTTLPVWLLGLSSDPPDSLYPSLPCQKLIPATGQCCSVVYAPMTFWAAGNDVQPQDLMSIMSTEINSATWTSAANLQIEYIGSVMDPSLTAGGRTPGGGTDQALGVVSPPTASPLSNAASPAISAEQGNESQVKQSNSLTVVGGVVLGGLVAAFVGMFFVLVRRRRTKHRVVQVAMSKSEPDAEDGQSDGPTLEVDVMSDDIPAQQSNRDYDAQDDYHPSSYTFDLANTMKNDVMGTYGYSHYGPTSISVVPPYPMVEETSDSEVDSWAQTDGTVGSLEERLEEITAEI